MADADAGVNNSAGVQQLGAGTKRCKCGLRS